MGVHGVLDLAIGDWTPIDTIRQENDLKLQFWYFMVLGHCLKITQNVAFEFFNFGIFHQFLSY